MILSGVVEHIIYKNAENGYTVLELQTHDQIIVTVGIMPLIAEGEQIEVEGNYTTHKTYGQKFVVTTFASRLPVTETAILKYLSSGIVQGVREKSAHQLIEAFGPETLEVLENEPQRVAQLKGFSLQRAQKIANSMADTMGVKSILLYFQQFGITPNAAFKIYRQWGMKAYDILRQNPYRLCEINGIGFETADRVAESMGYDRASTNRIEAGIIYIINHNLYGNGHTFLPKQKLCQIAQDLLGAEPEAVAESLQSMIDSEVLVYEPHIANTDGVYLRWAYDCEKSITDRVLLASKFVSDYEGNFEEDIEQIQQQLHICFAERQKQAIREACQQQMMILTGGPGTGKTTTLNGIIKAFEKKGMSFLLAAPTGRAAKRIAELTGKSAQTIHRLLEYQPREGEFVFLRNKENPLSCDAVIVDEASMVDLSLFAHLLDAMTLSTKLILVGDSAQLPPVGAGRIFKDILDSEIVATTQLTEIFRQAQESLIITNAHAVLNGQKPILTEKKKDFFFLRQTHPQNLLDLVCDLCSTRLPNAYGYDPFQDIQVLSPTRKGSTGTVSLNNALRQALNPSDGIKRELTFRGQTFREGDKVMQIRNNYSLEPENPEEEPERGVFNGDIGIVESVHPRDETLVVRYDERRITYTLETLEDLELAYAITVHKSQGSEFNAVILPLLDGSDLLFTRNLLYTAITRAKQLLIIVGSSDRILQMIQNVRSDKRYSGLKYRLLKEFEQQ